MILFLGGIAKAIGGVVNTVGGLVSGAVGGKPGGGGLGGLIGGVFDTFSKIGGGGFLGMVGGMLGGPIGAVAGNLLGNIVGGGKLPLPGGFGGMLSQLPGLIGKGLEALNPFGQAKGMLDGLNKALGLVGDIMGKLGIGKPQANPAMGLIGKLIGNLGNLGNIFKPGGPGGPVPGGQTGGTAPSTGGGEAAKPGTLLDAGTKAYDALGNVEKEIANLDPNDPKYQQKLMQLQQKMQRLQEMIAMIQKMMDARHQMAMQTIQSIHR